MNADDVTRAVRLALDALEPATDRDWQVPAAGLTWSCAETVDHMSDDLFAYAGQISLAKPSLTTYVPFGWQRRRDGGPPLTIFTDPSEGPAGMLQVLESCGALLAAMVTVAPPDRMSKHSYGPSNPSGFAAMGVVEVLAHMYDVAGGLKLDWQPPADLCAGALRRLFPQAPSDTDPWTALLWCTGRTDLPGRPAPVTWKWDASPR